MNKKVFFITGTSTNVGKTVISAAIMHYLLKNKMDAVYFKPVQTGGHDIDLNAVSSLLSYEIPHISSCAQYENPLAPDQAAFLERKTEIQINDINLAIKNSNHSVIVIEGAGGLLVPLNEAGETWLDFIKQIDCETILVSQDILGMINHTSLTLDRLKIEGQNPQLVIINQYKNTLNLKSLQSRYSNQTFKTLPNIENFNAEIWNQISFELFSTLNIDKIDKNEKLQDLDHQYIWHPYTQHKNSKQPLVAVKAYDSTLEFNDGRKMIDGSSSWWVNTIGHGRKEIAEAIYQQQQKLDHVLFAGITHEPAITLSKSIIQLTQGHLHKVFFSDNGSTAIEVALKMAFQKFANTGVKRTKFLGFHGSYHGDTFGAMSVAKSDGFHQVFEPLMFLSVWTRPLTHHASYLCPNGLEDRQNVYQELVDKFEKHQDELAGVIIEPLIQGAGGMLMQCPEFLQFLQTLCKKFEIPLILDEVFSGMGRIGEYFAFIKANLDPDIVCIAKGLTGGNLPLALTLAKQEFYDAFLHEDKAMALLHGHSFTGNPIACAAANATLKILQSENLIDKARKIENIFHNWIKKNKTKVNNARCLGAILAFELPQSGFNDYFSNSANNFISNAQNKGLYLRTLGNTIYFVPPLVMTENELDFSLEILSNFE